MQVIQAGQAKNLKPSKLNLVYEFEGINFAYYLYSCIEPHVGPQRSYACEPREVGLRDPVMPPSPPLPVRPNIAIKLWLCDNASLSSRAEWLLVQHV